MRSILEGGSEQLQENNNENRLTVRSQKKAIESVWKRRPAASGNHRSDGDPWIEG